MPRSINGNLQYPPLIVPVFQRKNRKSLHSDPIIRDHGQSVTAHHIVDSRHQSLSFFFAKSNPLERRRREKGDCGLKDDNEQ